MANIAFSFPKKSIQNTRTLRVIDNVAGSIARSFSPVHLTALVDQPFRQAGGGPTGAPNPGKMRRCRAKAPARHRPCMSYLLSRRPMHARVERCAGPVARPFASAAACA
jgi:hypothetical protein